MNFLSLGRVMTYPERCKGHKADRWNFPSLSLDSAFLRRVFEPQEDARRPGTGAFRLLLSIGA
jgi:hypothetical protein